MINNISHIELFLENCDSIKIKRENIEGFYIEGISNGIGYFNCYDENIITDFKRCDIFEVHIRNISQLEYLTLGCDIENVLDRLLKWKDIVAVKLYFSEHETEVNLPWDFRNDDENSYQEQHYDEEFDVLTIIVKENINDI